MTPNALRRLLAVATVAGVLLTGAACGSDDEPTPTDKSSQMTDEMSESPMTEKSDDMMDEKSASPMDDMSDDMTDDMSEK